MPVSGLVVSFCQEPRKQAAAIDAINREPRITTGLQEKNRLAVVLDTDSKQQDRQIWQWLRSLPGVAFLEVAFVGFDEDGGCGKDQGSVRDQGCGKDQGSVRDQGSGRDQDMQVRSATTQTSPPGNKDHRNDGC